MSHAEEEYEPGQANDDTGGYVPGESQSEEYTVATNGNDQDAYKPSVAFIQSNYVSCFEQKNSDSGFDKQSSSSSSGSFKFKKIKLLISKARHGFRFWAPARANPQA